MTDEYENIGTDSKYVESALIAAEISVREDIDNTMVYTIPHVKAILGMCFFLAANWNSHAFIEEEVKEYLNNSDKWCEEMDAALTQLKQERMENRRTE